VHDGLPGLGARQWGVGLMRAWLEEYAGKRGALAWPHVAITLYLVEEVSARQKGYSGRGWNDRWVVIGQDDLCGDPIFVDDPVVLTAAHGEGSWEEVPIAKSLDVMIALMNIAEAVCTGEEEMMSGLAKIAELNGDLEVDIEFWKVLIERF